MACEVPSLQAIKRYVAPWHDAINEALPDLDMGSAGGPTGYSKQYLGRRLRRLPV